MTVGIGRTFWLLMGAVIGLPGALGVKERLPYLVAIPAIPALIQIVLTPFFPKSPKFLYISEKKPTEAESAVRFYHGNHVDIKGVLEEYDREAQLTEKNPEDKAEPSMAELWRTRHLRLPFVICIAMVLSAECSGADITSQYSR